MLKKAMLGFCTLCLLGAVAGCQSNSGSEEKTPPKSSAPAPDSGNKPDEVISAQSDCNSQGLCISQGDLNSLMDQAQRDWNMMGGEKNISDSQDLLKIQSLILSDAYRKYFSSPLLQETHEFIWKLYKTTFNKK